MARSEPPKINAFELFLIQIVIYLILWMVNDYLASMLSLILAVISFAILLVSLVVELVERSRVPAWYYYYMAVSIIAPILSGVVYFFISGELNWVVNPFY